MIDSGVEDVQPLELRRFAHRREKLPRVMGKNVDGKERHLDFRGHGLPKTCFAVFGQNDQFGGGAADAGMTLELGAVLRGA